MQEVCRLSDVEQRSPAMANSIASGKQIIAHVRTRFPYVLDNLWQRASAFYVTGATIALRVLLAMAKALLTSIRIVERHQAQRQQPSFNDLPIAAPAVNLRPIGWDRIGKQISD